MDAPKTKTINLEIAEPLHARLVAIAARRGMLRGRVMTDAFEFYADAQDREHELAKEERPLTRKERGK